jgi:hypothetical protein
MVLTYCADFSDARELVAELEFVWDQIKNNSVSSNSSPRRGAGQYERSRRIQRGTDGHMKVLRPMSQEDEAEMESERQPDDGGDEEGYDDSEYDDGQEDKRGRKRWRQKVETALVKMTAEMAALREQIGNEREWRGRRRRTIGAWIGWIICVSLRHIFIDAVLLGILILWVRRRKDKRLEDLVKEALRIGKEYLRQLLPTR